MTDTDRALDRLRVANPLPSADAVEADELARFVSYCEERSDAMTGMKTVRRDETLERKQRRFTPALVFALSLAACLVVIGGAALLWQGDENQVVDSPEVTTPVVDEPTVTTLPTQEAIEEEAVPVEATAIASAVRLSAEPEYLATVGIGADGLPIVATHTFVEGEGSGTVRLIQCLDPACNGTEDIDVIDADWVGRLLQFTVAPNGDLYMVLGGAEESVVMFRNGAVTPLPPMFYWPQDDDIPFPILPSAFLEDGRPLLVGPTRSGLSLIVCEDPLCGSQQEIVLADTGLIHAPGMLSEGDMPGGVFIDGETIRIPYATGTLAEPLPETGYDGADKLWTTRIATIGDLDGTPAVDHMDVNEGLNEMPIASAMTDNGDLVIWFFSWEETDVPGSPEVRYSSATCGTDCTKSDAPALSGWAWPYHGTPDLRLISVFTEDVYDPAEYAAYSDAVAQFEEEGMSEEEGDPFPEMPDALGTNLVVAECIDTECTATVRSTIEAREGWWYLDSLDIALGPDGSTYVLVGSSGEAGDPGLTLYSFPPGTLSDLVEPIPGTAVAR